MFANGYLLSSFVEKVETMSIKDKGKPIRFLTIKYYIIFLCKVSATWKLQWFLLIERPGPGNQSLEDSNRRGDPTCLISALLKDYFQVIKVWYILIDSINIIMQSLIKIYSFSGLSCQNLMLESRRKTMVQSNGMWWAHLILQW